MESYNVEASYLGENFNVLGTVVLGRPDKEGLGREKGYALQGQLPIANNYKLGVSWLTGAVDNAPTDTRRYVYGVFGILGFTPHFYADVEVDRVQRQFDYGMLDYSKVGYEVIQGVNLFVTQEYFNPSSLPTNLNNHFEAYGMGIQYFPRTHWELYASARLERDTLVQDPFSSVFTFMLHYYP